MPDITVMDIPGILYYDIKKLVKEEPGSINSR
jgi:hypothetical protein